ncbi:MAG TPA: PAS domain-containing protein [Phenylobacterium sp.]|nr:PAS domain-containing protein [Phenylobacterium sp.]
MVKSPKPVDPSFQALAEVLALGMSYRLACSPDGQERRFLYVSDNCLALNGVTAEAVMADARTFYKLVVPEHWQLTGLATAQAIRDRKPLMVEYAIRKPDGELAWRRVTSAPRPELTAEGWSIWDGLQVDITERKLAELELEQQRQRLDLAVEAAGLGFWDYDVRHDRAAWSDRTKAIYGLSPEAEINFEIWFSTLIHPEDRAEMEAAYLAALQTDHGTFSVEHRALAPNGEVRWVLAHGRVLRDETGPRTVLGTVLDITERRLAEQQRQLVTNELAHRSRNGLAMIMAIVSQTARSAHTVKDFEAMLTARISAMARSQELVNEGFDRLSIADLFAAALEPFDASRFTVDPSLGDQRVNPDIALMLALLIHELGTNATKHGALSVAGGRIGLTADPASPGKGVLVWREVGGPPVKPPTRTGFGTRLIEAAMRSRGGSARAQFLPAGVEARIEFPRLET